MDVDAAIRFIDFIEARHDAYLNRQAGLPQPWTDDPIVQAHKFTNVYRILDYGSQFVMADLIDENLEPADQLMRLFLYRHTGRVDAWEYLALVGSGYPSSPSDLFEVRELWSDYRASGNPVFTGAYLVFPQSTVPGTDKVVSIIDLASRLSANGSFTNFLYAESQPERFAALRRNKGVADFMSMQILTDWGYTPHCGEDRENEFVVPGPGARKGAAALGMRADEAVRWARDNLSHLRLVDRPPSLMDAQNTLCEFSKYVRFAEKPVGKPYRPAHPGPQPEPVLPAHW